MFGGIFKRRAECRNAGNEPPAMKHACPLYDVCGIYDCRIGDVHDTKCARFPFLKENAPGLREAGESA